MRTPMMLMCSMTLLVVAATGCNGPSSPESDEVEGVAQQASVALPKQTITLSTGIQMAYLEMGDPDGEPVVFLHGYTDTSRSFYPTAAALAASSHHLRLLLLDQRGHGASSMPPEAQCAAAPEQCFEPSDMAADVLAFMNAKGLGHAHLVGHSMGSFVAQEVALTHPARVDSVVLIGTGTKLAGNVIVQDYVLNEPIDGSWKSGFLSQGYTWPQSVYNLTPPDSGPAGMDWIQNAWVVDPAADPAFIADILPETASTRMGTWIGVAHSLLATDNTERLKHLKVPALVIWATEDAIFYDSDQQDLRDSLDVAVAKCRTEYYFKQYGKRPLSPDGLQLDDIGHNTQWGAPNEVAKDIHSYLRHGRPTRDWYYSADGDPQQIVTQKHAAPIIHGKPPKHCKK